MRGSTSSWSSVRSGVPQGTILGPILSLIYVNDISSNNSSITKHFADDTKVYREIANGINVTRAIQTDIDHLANWATVWQLIFNPEKCETMRITHNRDKSTPSFVNYGSSNQTSKVCEGPRVLTSYDLSWGAQVDAAVNKVIINSIKFYALFTERLELQVKNFFLFCT